MKISSHVNLPKVRSTSGLRNQSPLAAASAPSQDRVDLRAPAPPSGEVLSKQSSFTAGKLLLGLGAGVALVMLAGCNGGTATPEQPLQANQARGDFGEYSGNFTLQDGRVVGDFGEYSGDYTVQGGQVQGDLGEYSGKFTVQNGHVVGDFGEYSGDYQVSREGNPQDRGGTAVSPLDPPAIRVKGDFGEYSGDYKIVTEGNVTRVVGDFGEYSGDFRVITNPDGSQHVQGDFGEYSGDYTVTPEAGGFHVKGDFGEYSGDYRIGGEAAADNALLHPLGVGSLLSPDSPHAPPRWPSAIKTDD